MHNTLFSQQKLGRLLDDQRQNRPKVRTPMNSYLTLQGSTYHFRFFIPERYQSFIGQKVIKMSLRTGRKRLARRQGKKSVSHLRLESTSKRFLREL